MMQMLDDNIVMTQSMTFSPYKKPFEERIAKWETQLNLMSEILDEWISVQRSWMYLEPIFSSPDIMQQLPLEAKRFATVDRTWRKVFLFHPICAATRCLWLGAAYWVQGTWQLLWSSVVSGRDTTQPSARRWVSSVR